MVFWNLLISLSATVPGLNLIFLSYFTPPSAGAVFFLAADLLAFDPVADLFSALFFLPTTFALGILKFQI